MMEQRKAPNKRKFHHYRLAEHRLSRKQQFYGEGTQFLTGPSLSNKTQDWNH